MRIAVKIFHVVVGILLTLSTVFQLLAMLAGVVFNANNDLLNKIPWLVPVWCAMLALLIAAFVLVVKKGAQHPWQPILLVAALIGALTALVVAFTLRDALPDHLNVSGATQGLTTWKLLYRHLSSSLVGALVAAEAGVQWILYARARRRTVTADTDPAQSTIGLDFFGGDEAAQPKKLKRSLRRVKAKGKTTENLNE